METTPSTGSWLLPRQKIVGAPALIGLPLGPLDRQGFSPPSKHSWRATAHNFFNLSFAIDVHGAPINPQEPHWPSAAVSQLPAQRVV